MRTTQSLTPRFDELPTAVELPVTGAISARTIQAAIELTSARRKVRRFVLAARYAQSIQCELARQANAAALAASPAESLKHALRRLFMEVTKYFHDHLDVAMPNMIRGALARLYKASQGGPVSGHVLFVDLRQLGVCEAICEPLVEQALEDAEQALLSMKLG